MAIFAVNDMMRKSPRHTILFRPVFTALLATVTLVLMVSFAATIVTTSCAKNEYDTTSYRPGEIVSQRYLDSYGYSALFKQEIISDELFESMYGKSYKDGCPVPREELRYLQVLHKDADGQSIVGELVVNKSIAEDVLEIFRLLYEASYPIEKIRLIDLYNADDNASMEADNSSAFNFRKASGQTRLSAHSKGLAIDINPLYNPYCKVKDDGSVTIKPESGRPYADRSRSFNYKIEKGDVCYTLFKEHGFAWGGEWSSCKDYQHFELTEK